MARKSGYKWVENIALYIHSENELFAYIGTPTNPRSSAVRFKDNQVNSPVKLPPISIRSLDERHPNTAKLQLKDTNFSAKIKFLIAFLERNEAAFTEANEDTSTIVTNIDELKNLKTEQILETVYRHTDFDKWFGLKKRPTIIFDSLIRVLSRPSRNSRQRAMTQIVSELAIRKELPKAFLLLLLGLRDELTISIFRELGRQQKFIYPFPEIAEYYFKHTTSPEIKKYAFYYLLNQNDDSIIQSSLYKDFRATFTIFSSISQSERVNQIIKGLSGDPGTAKKCLAGIYGFSTNQLSDLLLALFQRFKVTKNHRENLRIASLYLLKLVEVAPVPEICGFIIALNTLGKSAFVFEDDKKITSLKIKEGPTEYTSRYVIRRTIKLLELWNQIGLDEYLTRALLFYIKHIPPEITEIEKRRIAINRRLTGDWQKSHLTLRKFANKISSVLGEDKIQLYQAIMIQSKLNNRFTLEWLDTSFRSKTLILAIDETTGEDILSLFVNNLPKKLTKIVAKTIEERKNLEILDWAKTELNEDQLDQILTFFSTTQTFMPISLFKHIIDLIFSNNFGDIERIINYITSINHNQKPQISERYLQIAFDYIEANVYDNFDNPIISKFCTDFIIEWEKITFRKPREEDEYRFEALRIVYEKELKLNKPNTWDDISVETIAYVYRLLKLHVPSLIDGSLQYAMNKPNWEQLARHYLAMGIERPLVSEITKTRLKDVPKYLLRDIEGLIALITETILYCERNGFNRAFEDLLIQHLYRRGWNIDRNIARKLPGLFGNISPRLRSYFAAYLVFEQGEVSQDVLKFARDINNYQLRERVLRTLERFATPDILIVLAESEFSDISDASIEKFSNLNLNIVAKKQALPKLLRSTNYKLREIAKNWTTEEDIEPEIILREIVPHFEDMYEFYFQQIERIKHMNENKARLVFQFFKYIIWQPRMKNGWIKRVGSIVETLVKQDLQANEIKREFNQLIHTQIQQRMDTILPTVIEVKGI